MSLEQDLQNERVVHLDLNGFTRVEIGASVKTTVEKMRAEKHHCAVITDQGVLAGIFTDRDILQKIAGQPQTWNYPIEDFMTPAPVTVSLTDAANTALALMNREHFRNVPVVDEAGLVVGNLTHYAIIKYLADRFPESVYNLPPHPDRSPRQRDGA
jgi:CBS domain-containing protein